MKLFDNPWGFSVEHTNPFQLFPLLQELARSSGAEEVVDLSRGDPGYGFAPSVRGREFVSFLMFLDTKLNHAKELFAKTDREDENQILEEIAVAAHSAYVPALATRYLNDLSEFIQRCVQIAASEGVSMAPYDVLFELFKNSTMSGGTYHDPRGEKLVRMLVAWWHKKTLKTPFSYEDILFTGGASHAIGTIFKLLGEEGLQYLGHGDTVVVTSPVYAPYRIILQNRGLNIESISQDPLTGRLSEESLARVEALKNVKVLILIDPNNPTGFSLDKTTLQRLAKFAKDQDALIVSDEVYSAFFEERLSILDLAPERTLRIQSRSKIERSSGLRFGDVLIPPEMNQYMTEVRMKDLLPAKRDFRTAFQFAKGPGGVHGEFQHTTFLSGPDQYLGAAHLLLGEKDRREFRVTIQKNGEVFTKGLGLPHQGNLYYIIFDLNEVPGCTTQDIPPEQKIHDLAKLGVIFLPANMFFSEEDRAAKDRKNTVRASLGNGSPDKIKRAAEITRHYLTH
jgi:aspartate/methionine/tyrosine aminotransferase